MSFWLYTHRSAHTLPTTRSLLNRLTFLVFETMFPCLAVSSILLGFAVVEGYYVSTDRTFGCIQEPMYVIAVVYSAAARGRMSQFVDGQGEKRVEIALEDLRASAQESEVRLSTGQLERCRPVSEKQHH